MSLKINDLTWEQFRDRVPSACDLAIVPVGTIESAVAALPAPRRLVVIDNATHLTFLDVICPAAMYPEIPL